MSSKKTSHPEWVVILVVAALLLLPTYSSLKGKGSHGSRNGYGRSGDLKQLGLGLLMYSGESSGAFPTDIWTLYDETIIDSPRMLANPADLPGAEPDHVGIFDRYHNFGDGLRDDDPDPTSTILIAYPFRSGDAMHVNVLFVDGHLEGFLNLSIEEIIQTLTTRRVRRDR